jgi:hypothetical protein
MGYPFQICLAMSGQGRVGKNPPAYGAARPRPLPAREGAFSPRKSAVHRFATGGKMVATVPRFVGPARLGGREHDMANYFRTAKGASVTTGEGRVWPPVIRRVPLR